MVTNQPGSHITLLMSMRKEQFEIRPEYRPPTLK